MRNCYTALSKGSAKIIQNGGNSLLCALKNCNLAKNDRARKNKFVQFKIKSYLCGSFERLCARTELCARIF